MSRTLVSANANCNREHELKRTQFHGILKGMNDDTLNRAVKTRRDNLKRLVDSCGGAASLVKNHPEIDPTYVSQLLNGHSTFGEKAARNMERKAGLSSGWLDAADSDQPVTAATYAVTVTAAMLLRQIDGILRPVGILLEDVLDAKTLGVALERKLSLPSSSLNSTKAIGGTVMAVEISKSGDIVRPPTKRAAVTITPKGDLVRHAIESGKKTG